MSVWGQRQGLKQVCTEPLQQAARGQGQRSPLDTLGIVLNTY